jgi:molybdopterin-dependent oxidoreductase-like protein protein
VSARSTNLALFGLLAVAFGSGWLAFTLSGQPARATLVLHGAAGVGIVLLVPWKALLSARSLRRRRGRSLWWPSLVVALGVTVSLVFGVVHSAGRPYLGAGLTAIDFHVGAALVVLPFLAWHLLARPVHVRRTDLSRRSFLGLLGLSGASLLGFRLLPSAPRAATGSYATALPVATSWMFDQAPALTASAWRLRAGGREWSYEELLRFDDRLDAVLDCTGGWWAAASWSGVRLDRLLPAPPPLGSYAVRSATGYERRFPPGEPLFLALLVNGDPLPAGNGFPARLVAPRRRGFEWVKWVVEVRSEALPAWWQPPFPLQ